MAKKKNIWENEKLTRKEYLGFDCSDSAMQLEGLLDNFMGISEIAPNLWWPKGERISITWCHFHKDFHHGILCFLLIKTWGWSFLFLPLHHSQGSPYFEAFMVMVILSLNLCRIFSHSSFFFTFDFVGQKTMEQLGEECVFLGIGGAYTNTVHFRLKREGYHHLKRILM